MAKKMNQTKPDPATRSEVAAAIRDIKQRRQTEQAADRVLRGLLPQDREILMRFFLQEQAPDQICQAMGLTETQYHLSKSRAMQRFAAAVPTAA